MSSKNEEVPKEQELKAQLLDGRLYGLPAGWLVEQRRRTNPRYEGKVDQFFYQPHTRKQFRSLKAAMESIGTEAFEATNVDSHSQLDLEFTYSVQFSSYIRAFMCVAGGFVSFLLTLTHAGFKFETSPT
ncbi:hypothetical protein ACLB2K_065468 [Fragaria x ananassa]